MIDRAKRDRLAQALRQLLSGRIDNLAFDDLDCPGDITRSEDRALFEVFYAVWPYYDDFISHPMRLTEGEKLDLERYVIFLHSDVEFEWPETTLGASLAEWSRRALNDLTRRRLHLRPPKAPGDRSVWPFYRREDYDRALRLPRLLRGRAEPRTSANSV